MAAHPPADDEWNCCQCGEDLMLSGYNPPCYCGHSQCDTCHTDNMPDPYCDCCRPARPGGPPRRPRATAGDVEHSTAAGEWTVLNDAGDGTHDGTPNDLAAVGNKILLDGYHRDLKKSNRHAHRVGHLNQQV